eukprot:jgi/Psemu1/292083/fgenesh1_pg.910_\
MGSNINFEDWIADAPDEVTEWNNLSVNGNIPAYVHGTWIRNGGGTWTSGNNSNNDEKNDDAESYSHVFDGFAKISAYRVCNGRVEHQARFLRGNWYRKFVEDGNKLPPSLGTGPILDASGTPKTGPLRLAKALVNVATAFDNTPVNIWDYDPNGTTRTRGTIAALTDAPPRVRIDSDTMETVSSSLLNPLARGVRGYELLTTAHPLYALDGDHTYNVAVELGLPHARVNLIKETPGGDRTVIGSFPVEDGVPYFHSFGLSRNYAVVAVQPLRFDAGNLSGLMEEGVFRSMKHASETRVVVLALDTGECVLDQRIPDPLYFYHAISTAELEGDDGVPVLSLRLCAYETPDQITGDDQFLRLERNRLHPGGRFCDIVCDLREQTVALEWDESIAQGFELPVTRYSRSHGGSHRSPPIDAHPRYVYSFGAYALGATDFDAWGLFKFDTEQKSIAAFYRTESVYLSEPVFVADPEGSAEDDGVLLCQAYFGRERETKLLVLDARTMDALAEAGTGTRVPMDFHGAWIPSKSGDS